MKAILPSIVCKNAKQFLSSLSPTGKIFGASTLTERWLYRGQGNADHRLVPSIFRKDEQGKHKLPSLRDFSDHGQFLLAERDILVRFFEIADKRGLVLPDDSQKMRLALETMMSGRGEEFVPKGWEDWQMSSQALSLMALAQHYHVPTRLLDWSRLPYVAAYFAAEGGCKRLKNKESQGEIVVWAFYFPLLGKHDVISASSDPIRVVTAPSATNPNLKAQQGVFTLVRPNYTNEKSGNYVPMDEMLKSKAETAKPATSDADKLIVGCRLRKITVPLQESEELLYLLARWDISATSVYPGYQNIIDDLWHQYERM